MILTEETPVEKLIECYTKDILYDCHSIETRIEYSNARLLLQLKGKESLKHIANEMNSLFSNGSINYDLLMAYAHLICGIINNHKLPNPPYGYGVKYGDQDPKLWIGYCIMNG